MSGTTRILVVDDDSAVLAMTSMVLGMESFDVTTVRSGIEALRAARDGAFDLVILDINMPEMDGWETLRLLKSDEGLAGLPVIMFSVKGEVRDKVHGLQEGAIDYLTKPFQVDDLLARVRRVLNGPEGGAPRAHSAPGRP